MKMIEESKRNGYQHYSPADLSQRRQAGKSCELIDVRTPLEFREIHVEFAAVMFRSISWIQRPSCELEMKMPRSRFYFI